MFEIWSTVWSASPVSLHPKLILLILLTLQDSGSVSFSLLFNLKKPLISFTIVQILFIIIIIIFYRSRMKYLITYFILAELFCLLDLSNVAQRGSLQEVFTAEQNNRKNCLKETVGVHSAVKNLLPKNFDRYIKAYIIFRYEYQTIFRYEYRLYSEWQVCNN